MFSILIYECSLKAQTVINIIIILKFNYCFCFKKLLVMGVCEHIVHFWKICPFADRYSELNDYGIFPQTLLTSLNMGCFIYDTPF